MNLRGEIATRKRHIIDETNKAFSEREKMEPGTLMPVNVETPKQKQVRLALMAVYAAEFIALQRTALDAAKYAEEAAEYCLKEAVDISCTVQGH